MHINHGTAKSERPVLVYLGMLGTGERSRERERPLKTGDNTGLLMTTCVPS